MARVRLTADEETHELQPVTKTRLAEDITNPADTIGAAVASMITGGGVPIPEASTAAKGIVRIATEAETIDGLDGLKAVSPAGFSVAVKAREVELKSVDYASLDALFTARQAIVGPAIIRIAPGAYTHGPLTISRSETTVEADGATMTLAGGSNASQLTIGPDALSITLRGGVWDGNKTNQSGTSHGVYWEPYVGAARIADRSTGERLQLINHLTDGWHEGAKRIQVHAYHVSVRDSGRRCFSLSGSDSTLTSCAAGIADYGYYVDGWTHSIVDSVAYSTQLAGFRFAEGSRYSRVIGGYADNNFAKGAWIEGDTASSTLDVSILGTQFRKNSLTLAGAEPEVFIKNARAVYLAAVSARQDGVSQTSYAVFTDTGVADVFDTSQWEPLAHVTGIYNSPTTVYRAGGSHFRTRADGTVQWGAGAGTYDVNLYRSTTDILKTDDYFQALRFLVHGTAGAGFFGFDAAQTADPSAPAGSGARMFTKLVGGKVQLCVRFPTGAVQVLATEP